MLSNVSYVRMTECEVVANYCISKYQVILQKPTGATTSTSLAHLYIILSILINFCTVQTVKQGNRQGPRS